MTGTLASLQIGMPRTYVSDADDAVWVSGIAKAPVADSVELTTTGFVGDGQADLKNHGGPDKAINAYPASHYPDWRAEIGEPSLAFGAFGENLSIDGLAEGNVCVGDTWLVGESVRLQISQPRQPCWKLAKHLRRPDMVALVNASGRSGWYFRVLQTGRVRAGDLLCLIERPCPQFTIRACNEIMLNRKHRRGDAAALAACEWLSESWKKTLAAVGS